LGQLQQAHFHFDHLLRCLHLVVSFRPRGRFDNEDSTIVSEEILASTPGSWRSGMGDGFQTKLGRGAASSSQSDRPCLTTDSPLWSQSWHIASWKPAPPRLAQSAPYGR